MWSIGESVLTGTLGKSVGCALVRDTWESAVRCTGRDDLILSVCMPDRVIAALL